MATTVSGYHEYLQAYENVADMKDITLYQQYFLSITVLPNLACSKIKHLQEVLNSLITEQQSLLLAHTKMTNVAKVIEVEKHWQREIADCKHFPTMLSKAISLPIVWD